MVEKPKHDERVTVLSEAQKLVYGVRQDDYGHPMEDFTRTGKMWAIILGLPEVTAEQVGMCMIALKLSREINRSKRDNLVDIAGYVETIALVKDEREARMLDRRAGSSPLGRPDY